MKKNDPLHIAFNIDANYTQHCAVTLVSIFENNKKEKVIAHIVAPSLPKDDQKILQQLALDYNNEVKFYFPHASILAPFSIKAFSKRISLTTYYRCLLSQILPENIGKVIYLDCDILVRGSLRPFWDTDLEEQAVGVIEDVGCNDESRYLQLCYPSHKSYFNAGVLLINLAYWRKYDIAQQCIDFFKKHPERIRFNDQDLLNIVLVNNKTFLSIQWNCQDGFYRNCKNEEERQRNENLISILRSPVILHFTNRKPWDFDNLHPLRHEYFMYLELTPWKGWNPLSNFSLRIKRFFRLLPFTIGLRRKKYLTLN